MSTTTRLGARLVAPETAIGKIMKPYKRVCVLRCFTLCLEWDHELDAFVEPVSGGGVRLMYENVGDNKQSWFGDKKQGVIGHYAAVSRVATKDAGVYNLVAYLGGQLIAISVIDELELTHLYGTFGVARVPALPEDLYVRVPASCDVVDAFVNHARKTRKAIRAARAARAMEVDM